MSIKSGNFAVGNSWIHEWDSNGQIQKKCNHHIGSRTSTISIMFN